MRAPTVEKYGEACALPCGFCPFFEQWGVAVARCQSSGAVEARQTHDAIDKCLFFVVVCVHYARHLSMAEKVPACHEAVGTSLPTREERWGQFARGVGWLLHH